jgi:hypothetical protein
MSAKPIELRRSARKAVLGQGGNKFIPTGLRQCSSTLHPVKRLKSPGPLAFEELNRKRIRRQY